MTITAQDLHNAAQLAASFGADETQIARYGLPFGELEQFVNGSDWREGDADGPYLDLDPVALAMGITIGIIAAERKRHEQSLTLTAD